QLGTEKDIVDRKHFEFFLDLAHRIGKFRGTWHDVGVEVFLDDEANFRSATEWAFADRSRSAEVFKLLASIGGTLYEAHPRSVAGLMERALKNSKDADLLDIAWVDLHLARGLLAIGKADGVEELIQRSLTYFEGPPRIVEGVVAATHAKCSYHNYLG